jgi:hypothetical protein
VYWLSESFAKSRVLTSTLEFTTTVGVFVPGKVALSFGELGTVAGIQLEGVFQSLVGFVFQVALPAKEWAEIKHERRQMTGKAFHSSIAAEMVASSR